MIEIELEPADEYQATNYGILLRSKLVYRVVGSLVHNPEFWHEAQVWENRNGKDPHGRQTADLYSYLLSAQPTVIATSPRGVARGYAEETLTVDSEVKLSLAGYRLGIFRVVPLIARDPQLIRIGD